MDLKPYSDLVARLWSPSARERFSNRNVSPAVTWGILIGFAGAIAAVVLLIRCDNAAKQGRIVDEAEDKLSAMDLVDKLRAKLPGIEKLAPVPDAPCPAAVTRVSVVQQPSFVYSILRIGAPPEIPPAQSTPFVWIAQQEELPVAQRKKHTARLRELLADPYLAVVVPIKAEPIQPSMPGHFEGQIQIVDTQTTKPVCATTILFDVYKPTNLPEDQAWSQAFWKAAEPALAKAAPAARFRLD